MNFQDPQIAALIQALQGSASLDQSDQLLQQQQQTAQANRSQAQGAHSYGAGAGLGNGLAALFGGIHQSQLEGQQKENLGKRDAYMDALIRALGGGGDEAGGANPNPTMPL